MIEKHESDNVELGHLPWTILYTKHQNGRLGQTFYDKRVIEISNRAKNRCELDTLIHEMLHACCPWFEEFYVEETATDIANVLWKMGYRKT